MIPINQIEFAIRGRNDRTNPTLNFSSLTQIPIHIPRVGEIVYLPDNSGRVDEVAYDYATGRVTVYLV